MSTSTSAPHTALDPITVAAEITLALQTMVTRRADVFDPAVVTIAQVVAWIRGLAVGLAGEEAIDDLAAPIMGAEDFSYVLERVPGMMAFLGARPATEDPATAPQNHSNRVVFDEPTMALGVALYTAAALDFLGG